MKKYTCRCGNSFESKQKPLCCPACLQHKDFIEGDVEPWITDPIGEPTDAKIVRGRENVPIGDKFEWWSSTYEYRDKKTGEVFKLEDLQEKYHMGFGQSELWRILKRDYITEDVYTMNVNHPQYGKTGDIVFED